jgi:N-acetylglucosaminyldiphosphoundecaprenol N-acetyl-beta-D-mannosaminyltransferase
MTLASHDLGHPGGARAAPVVFGIPLAAGGIEQIVATLRTRPAARQALPLFTINVAHVTSLRRDAAFRRAYRQAWLVTVDGTPVHVFARLSGAAVEKVAGSDLVARLLATPIEGVRGFFVVSSEATARALRARLVARGFPDDALAFVVPPFGFERDEAYSRALAARIAAHGTTHLFMGVGAPKSEIWVVAWKAQLGGCYALCVGAGPDYVAGTRRRAPVLLQKTGLEWAWRFGAEPRRLARRYIFDAFGFLWIVAFRKLDLRTAD